MEFIGRGAPVTRRRVLAGGVAAGALMAFSGCSRDAVTARKPNIIFILADDLGVADLSCYGAPQIRTPAIDSIARAGALFTQAYANSAVCSASRTAIITGRYQYRLSLGLEEPLAGRPHIGLPPEQPTLPSLLKHAGYATYLVGKWHLGELPEFGPLQSGYDHFWGFRGPFLDYFSHRENRHADLWDDDREIESPGYLTDLIGAHTVDIIEKSKAGTAPFFISVHFNAPHWPWEGPGDEAHAKEIGDDAHDKQGAKLATYGAMVEAMDRQVGLILKALTDTKQLDNTIVLFTSDNGGERLSNTWPFTGKKSELLEGGIRVPAVVRWSGHVPAGMVSDQVMIHMDWLPTLLAAGGGAPDPKSPSDGMNLLPVLTQHATVTPRTLYWRYKANAQRAVRDGNYKALKIANNTYLFDVVADPLERADLKKKLPEVYQKLTAEWDAWNATMLPENEESYTYNNAAAEWADHINTPVIDRKQFDDGGKWPD